MGPGGVSLPRVGVACQGPTMAIARRYYKRHIHKSYPYHLPTTPNHALGESTLRLAEKKLWLEGLFWGGLRAWSL